MKRTEANDLETPLLKQLNILGVIETKSFIQGQAEAIFYFYLQLNW